MNVTLEGEAKPILIIRRWYHLLMKPLRFGLVGTGVGGEFIAGALKALEGEGLVKMQAVVGRKPSKTENFARKFGAEGWYTCLRHMLTREELDAVAISTPHYLHFPQAIAVMEAGLHVLVDKPMAINLVEADEMVKLAERMGLKLGVILEFRFDPKLRRIKALVDAGKLGKLIMGEAIVEWFRPEEYYRRSDWRGRWATEGGGALINQAIHTIDLLLWLMGDVEKLWSLVGTVAHDIEVEDLAVAALKFRSGAFGVIQGSTAVYPGLPTRLEVHGTEGTAIWEGGKIKLISMRSGETYEEKEEEKELASWARPEAVPIHNHVELIRDFVKAIIDDRRPYVDGVEGRRSLEVIRAIYLSGRSGEVVELPLKEGL
ncbi:MAG TPA: Gfo/Idh/MocA family oxidoreductase [Thermofilaceae archaeon]|nr:Gfo/Idh/MocA family oxidoreductase [Thermofilaceae archaeon]